MRERERERERDQKQFLAEERGMAMEGAEGLTMVLQKKKQKEKTL